jgi:hypothetical protein
MAADAGLHYVMVTTAGGSTSSDMALLTVNKATPEIVWEVPPEIPFGVPLDSGILSARASRLGIPVEGAYAYTPPEGTLLYPGPGQPLTVEFTPADRDNYESASAYVMIDVSLGIPEITWPRPSDIVYGTALDSTQLNASASFGGEPLDGSFDYTPFQGAVLNAGSDQVLTAYFNPAQPEIYSPVSITTLINVLKAEPTITWSQPLGYRLRRGLGGSPTERHSVHGRYLDL